MSVQTGVGTEIGVGAMGRLMTSGVKDCDELLSLGYSRVEGKKGQVSKKLTSA